MYDFVHFLYIYIYIYICVCAFFYNIYSIPCKSVVPQGGGPHPPGWGTTHPRVGDHTPQGWGPHPPGLGTTPPQGWGPPPPELHGRCVLAGNLPVIWCAWPPQVGHFL